MLILPVKYRGRRMEDYNKTRKQRIRQKPRCSQCVLNSIVDYFLIHVGGTSQQHLPLRRKWAGHMTRNYKYSSALTLYFLCRCVNICSVVCQVNRKNTGRDWPLRSPLAP